MEKYYLVNFKRTDGSHDLYSYRTTIKNLKKGDLVFVKMLNGMYFNGTFNTDDSGIQIVQIVQETGFDDEIEEYSDIIEKVDLRDGKIYFKGKQTKGEYDRQIKKYEKKKTWLSRIFG